MIATLKNMRAPGMAWRRAPVLASAARVISYILLVTGAGMLAALVMLTVDRQYDGVFFDAGLGGEPMLFSHLSWLYFTGIHAVMVVAALAVISEIVPTFSRKPLFSHSAVAGSLVAAGVLGTARLDAEPLRQPAGGGLRLLHDARRDPLPGPYRPHLRRLDPDDVGRRRLDPRSAGPRHHGRRRARDRPRRRARDLGRQRRAPAGEHGRRAAGHDPGHHRLRPHDVRGASLLAPQGHRPGRPRGAGEGRGRAHLRERRSSTASPCSSPGSRASPSTSSATSRTTASRRST